MTGRVLIDTPEIKAFEGNTTVAVNGDGTFEAIVSTFGNVDLDGDVMVKGCFERSLKERGYPSVLHSHDRSQLIGVVDEIRETELGLYVKGRLLIGEVARADEVYAGMKAKNGDGKPALRDWSIGFRVRKAHWAESDDPLAAPWGGEVREITDVELWEVSPTLVGANPQAGLLSVKSADDFARLVAQLTGTKAEKAEPEPAPAPVFTDRKHAARVAELLATPLPESLTTSTEEPA